MSSPDPSAESPESVTSSSAGMAAKASAKFVTSPKEKESEKTSAPGVATPRITRVILSAPNASRSAEPAHPAKPVRSTRAMWQRSRALSAPSPASSPACPNREAKDATGPRVASGEAVMATDEPLSASASPVNAPWKARVQIAPSFRPVSVSA